MGSLNRQMQLKVTESAYWQVEARAHERGITTSEFLRDLVEREVGQSPRVSLGEQLAIEIQLEVRALLFEFVGRFVQSDAATVEAMSTEIPVHARAEAQRRIREATIRKGDSSC